MRMTPEDKAVRYANLSGVRWEDLDEDGREYYRRLVRLDEAYRAANPPRDYEVPLMPPLKF
jgi:hypothetical protein